MTKEQLEQRLRAFPGVVGTTGVEVVGHEKFVAKVLVKSFDGTDEADRQARIYEFLRERFSEDEMQAVEYIITNAPGDPAP